jgi:hypothetical protein
MLVKMLELAACSESMSDSEGPWRPLGRTMLSIAVRLLDGGHLASYLKIDSRWAWASAS